MEVLINHGHVIPSISLASRRISVLNDLSLRAHFAKQTPRRARGKLLRLLRRRVYTEVPEVLLAMTSRMSLGGAVYAKCVIPRSVLCKMCHSEERSLRNVSSRGAFFPKYVIPRSVLRDEESLLPNENKQAFRIRIH